MLALPLALGCRATLPAASPSSPPLVLQAGDPAPALPREGIDVLVWNVHKARDRAWADELRRLAAGMELVLLQEAYLAPRMTDAFGEQRQWLMARSFAYARREGSPATGVAIGSTAAAHLRHARVSPATEPVSATPKASLMTTYAIEGSDQELLVVCVHAINFRRAEALAAQLDGLRSVIAAHEGPVLLGGDLNTHHPARLDVLARFTDSLGLQPVFTDDEDDGRRRYRGHPLDHVFVRGLVVDEARVVTEAHSSDHAPMVVRVSLP